MAVLSFTDRWIKSATVLPGQVQTDYRDEVVEGLGLRISSGGRKAWTLTYRIDRRLRRLTFGKYPDKPLADARLEARNLLVCVAKGQDPASDKRIDRQAETFADLCAEYLEHHAKPNKKSWQADERLLGKDLLPLWAHRKANGISRREVIALLDNVVQRGSPIMANRLLALLRKVFNFGIEREILENNPCWAVRRPVDEKPRQGQRVLDYKELRKVWSAIELQDSLIQGIFKLRILTAQRGTEIRSMKWSDLDFETGWWTIPETVTKNKLSHRVPLTPQSLAILEAIRQMNLESEYVFPSPTNFKSHIDNIHKAVDRLQKESGVSFTDRDFRRTGPSHMTGQLEIPRLVVSKLLNHVESGITRVYDRHSYDREKRAALEAWEQLLFEVVISDKRKTFEQDAHAKI